MFCAVCKQEIPFDTTFYVVHNLGNVHMRCFRKDEHQACATGMLKEVAEDARDTINLTMMGFRSVILTHKPKRIHAATDIQASYDNYMDRRQRMRIPLTADPNVFGRIDGVWLVLDESLPPGEIWCEQ